MALRWRDRVPENSELEQTHAEKMLAAVETAIENYVTGGGQRTTSIGGVSFTYSSLSDLLRLKSYYAAEVRREKGCKLYRIGLRLPC